MILAGAAALMMLVFGGAAEDGDPARPLQFAQVTVRQQIVIRSRTPPGGSSQVSWREGRGPRCVPMRAVIGATQPARNSVDLLMRDRSRVRARLENGCTALDFYSGFYVNGTPDGMICADRDAVRSRMGGECEIEQFRSLTAVRP